MAKMKTATKKTVTKKRTAKKGAVNKSQSIRDYLNTHKNTGPKEVQAALAKKGIKVTEALVSNVKTNAKKKAAAKKVKVRVATKPVEHTPLQDMKEAGSLMVKAVELVISAGAAEAKQLISTASEIVKKAQGGE